MRDQCQQREAKARGAPAPRRGTLGALLVAASLSAIQPASAQETGKQIFQKWCAACHTVGGGRLVGPDLAGVNDKRPEDWLVRFIKSSQALAKSGDKTAMALVEEYKMPMPDQALSDDQVKKVLAHIKESGGGPAAGKEGLAAQAVASAAQAHPDEIRLGQDLFEGKVRFAKLGPSCNACHDVRNDKVASGGILAAELSLVLSRMGRQGVQSILANSPFPVMQAAYKGKDLSEKEITALIGFLQHVEKEHSRQLPRETGLRMASAGVGGVIVLVGIFALAGRRRKNRCVNQDIYDRQVKTE